MAKKQKYTRTHDYKRNDDLREIPDEESLTVPNMSMTVKEMLAKHIQGMMVPEVAMLDEEDPDMDQINPLSLPTADLTDLDRMRLEAQSIADKKTKREQAKQDATPAGSFEDPDSQGEGTSGPTDSKKSGSGSSAPEPGGQATPTTSAAAEEK